MGRIQVLLQPKVKKSPSQKRCVNVKDEKLLLSNGLRKLDAL